MKHKNKQTSDQSFIVFDLYKKIVNANNYIDYQKLLATVLLENQIGFDSKVYKELVPMLSETESSNTEAINLKTSNDEQYQKFLTTYNNYFISLIKQGFCVEIFPNVILFKSKNTDHLKIVFDKTKVLTRG
ncbi:MSC_0623 family F1-like ATPase-associated protein [Mycoplasma mycoides]|uniref:MSC_0623 family F1-like ATPase-associated protein n=1 Tax=Mycoplasma mycoides TaxID=2102 RepID=UPI0010195FA8|nr:DUF2714 domain-containing protein [Mycoplasma mycoides]SRX64358.1 hypothetical protein MMC68H_00626 [Mycoplasma mycoides subsp. capri]